MSDGATDGAVSPEPPVGTARQWLQSTKQKILRRLSRLLEESVRRDRAMTLPLLRLLGMSRERRFHGLSLVPLEWLDENHDAATATMEPSGEGRSHGPRIGAAQRVERVDLPAVRRYEFGDASVCATSSSVVLGDRVIVERVPGAKPSRCDYSTGHLWAHGSRTAILRLYPVEHLDAGVFLGGNGAFNYYHWMIEILPKLEFARDSDGPLLVSDDVAQIATFREALDAVAGRRDVVFLKKDRTYRVKRLVYIDSRAMCPFNLRAGEEFRVEDFILRQSSIDFLRSRLCGPAHRSPPSRRQRIFLARKATRRNYNQEEVFDVFQRLGFRKVHLEDLTLREQIDEIAGAEMIAGPTGAAWTNLAFAAPGTKCLCWMAEELHAFSGYSSLAHAVGADLRYVTYATGTKDTARLYLMDYRVDPVAIARETKALMGR